MIESRRLLCSLSYLILLLVKKSKVLLVDVVPILLPIATKFTVSLQRLQRIRMTGLVHESPVSSLVLPVLMTIIVIVINTAIVIAIIDTFAFTIITAIYQGADETHPVRP